MKWMRVSFQAVQFNVVFAKCEWEGVLKLYSS